MNRKHHKLLHYMLIMLLMLAPVRSMFAAQFMACDMDMSSEAAVRTEASSLSEHCQRMQGSASTVISALTVNNDNINSDVVANGDQLMKRCCDSNSACSADCHFSITLSLFLPTADYSPVFLSTGIFENISTALVVRELTPPSRPPLSLYS